LTHTIRRATSPTTSISRRSCRRKEANIRSPDASSASGTRTSLIYRNAVVYGWVMRALYGRHHGERLRAVAEQVPVGSSVLELCCGPGELYERHLRTRVSGYIGLDVNPRFVSGLTAAGASAWRVDLTDPRVALPHADVVIMQASLYHFLPDADAIVRRMLAAAGRCVIVSEPIRNLSSSTLPLVGAIGKRAADPGVGGHAERFTEATLDALMAPHDVREAFPAPGGRDKIYVIGVSG
jgi:SAM-dependent methyltransferase